MTYSRRQILSSAFIVTAAVTAQTGFAKTLSSKSSLLGRAKAALNAHSSVAINRDTIGIIDFSLQSSVPRFQIVHLANGRVFTLLVAHGKGSDLRHSGFLKYFSNINGSEATSAGAYLCSDKYVGKHGNSRRLIGLDPENSEAYNRAIVVHGADYVSEKIVGIQGKLGRSQGCFAVAQTDLDLVLQRLGKGSLIYAGR